MDEVGVSGDEVGVEEVEVGVVLVEVSELVLIDFSVINLLLTY